jgi:hypothetical protein
MEIVKINPQEFGLTDDTAKNIQAQFEPMLAKMTELEGEYNKVIAMPIGTPEATKQAKELRLKYVKVRTGTEAIHKKQKEFYLSGGRFVDGWRNAQKFASQGKEEKLEAIEKYAENLEKERRNKLHESRIEMIRPFVPDTSAYDFRLMEEDVFQAFLTAKQTAFEDEQKAKAEAVRIEQEKAEADRIEKARLMEEARISAEELQKARAELKAKEDAERNIAEAKAKADADAKAEADRLAKAPIKKQLKAWMDEFKAPDNAPNSPIAKEIQDKFESFKKWADVLVNNS